MNSKKMINHFFILLLLLFRFAVPQEWNFLDTHKTGAEEFIKSHPQADGRGVVIIILDTGVDMGTPGLDSLPEGGVKVIDAQDFSGEGDVFYEKAVTGIEGREDYLENSDGLRLYGYKQLSYAPVDSVWYIGFLDEKRFKNSVIPDVNNNERRDDKFGFAVIRSSDGWIVFADLDGDGNLSDEQAVWNYKEKFQAIKFRGRNVKNNRNLATFALNIFPDEQRVNFHYDGSSHGTHVAGIAAGYRINGQQGLNGIAPGAKIISLKIGDGRLAGGATTSGSMLDAYEYGIEFARSYEGPVVFNMSFGIGSEIEGQADMDLILNDLLKENPQLVFCLSAGNEGPGISTVGLPAASARAVTVGALNSRESARDVYGADLAQDKIFVFSSRGGELNKPDILAPGSASSTVPPFSTRENKWGTSMAAPQAAGAVALIMSAAHNASPGLPVFGPLIKKALKNSARTLDGYLPVDQGSGVINIPLAYKFYRSYVSAEHYSDLEGYDISTTSPIYSSERGEAAYWRFGTYFPDEEHKQRFYINPLFSDKMDADQKHNFYRAFNLKASEPWIKLNKKSTYIKGEKAAIVDVWYDASRIKKPGLYSGRIIAYRKSGLVGSNKPLYREFDLLCNVIKPITFSENNEFHWDSGPLMIDRGDVKRLFFDIPLKASAATVLINGVKSGYADIRAYLFDPRGRQTRHFAHFQSEKSTEKFIRLNGDDLVQGIWELDLYADFRDEKSSEVQVSIAFSTLASDPQTITVLKFRNGDKPRGSVDITNYASTMISSSVHGGIFGIRKINYIEDDTDHYEYPFSVDDSYERVEFDLEIEPEIFNRFTDFAINVKNYDGKALKADGLTYRKHKIVFVPPSSGDYILEFIPAFARAESKQWYATLKESYFYFKTLALSGNSENFYPKVKKRVDFEVNGILKVAPAGFYLFGELWLDNSDKYKFRTVVPMHIPAGLDD